MPNRVSCPCFLCALLHVRQHACCVARWPAGTSLRYKPGVIVCGGGLVHDCGTSRAIGYYLEALVLLALFAKKVRPMITTHLLTKPSELLPACTSSTGCMQMGLKLSHCLSSASVSLCHTHPTLVHPLHACARLTSCFRSPFVVISPSPADPHPLPSKPSPCCLPVILHSLFPSR